MSLESRLNTRRFFDPTSKVDMAAIKTFMKTNGWGTKCCPFFLEYPYKSIPDMVKDKIVLNAVGVKLCVKN